MNVIQGRGKGRKEPGRTGKRSDAHSSCQNRERFSVVFPGGKIFRRRHSEPRQGDTWKQRLPDRQSPVLSHLALLSQPASPSEQGGWDSEPQVADRRCIREPNRKQDLSPTTTGTESEAATLNLSFFQDPQAECLVYLSPDLTHRHCGLEAVLSSTGYLR